MRPLPVVALFLGLAIATVPAAGASPVPPGPCAEKEFVDGPVRVYMTMGCAAFVDVLETECTWGGHWTTLANAGNVYVRVWTCDPEFVDPYAPTAASCTCDPMPLLLLVQALLVATPCIADALTYALVHSEAVNPVNGDCIVDAYPPYECVGGWGEDRTVSLGFVRLVVRVCTGGPLPPVGDLLQ